MSEEQTPKNPRVWPVRVYPPVPYPDALDPNSPNRYQTLNVDAAAWMANVSPLTIRNWIKRGWLTEDEVKPKETYGHYRFDTHALFRLSRMGKAGRHRKFTPDRYEWVRQLLRDGWEPGEWREMSYREAGVFCGVQGSTVRRWIVDGLLEINDDYKPGDIFTIGSKNSYDLDNLKAFAMQWINDHIDYRGGRPPGAKNKNPRRKSAKTLRRERDLAVVAEFENGYVEPSMRQDRSDLRAIQIQERSEKTLAKMFGNRAVRNRPITKAVPAEAPEKP